MRKATTDHIEIRRRMLDKGIVSLAELSRQSGVNPITLHKVMSGKSQPSFNTMVKIMTALDISEVDAGAIFFSQDLRTTQEVK